VGGCNEVRSGFLHYAAHDKTVSSFGRNDNSFGFCLSGETSKGKSNGVVAGRAPIVPPIAKNAMDGAPFRWWPAKENNVTHVNDDLDGGGSCGDVRAVSSGHVVGGS
jgi:hypothetical protein